MGITSEGFTAVLGLLVVASCAYAIGRLQEWLKRGGERDEAYRDGYHEATTALWTLAVKEVQATAERGKPAVVSGNVGRHHVSTATTRDLRRHTPEKTTIAI
jgi:hypothetical protein